MTTIYAVTYETRRTTTGGTICQTVVTLPTGERVALLERRMPRRLAIPQALACLARDASVTL